MKRKIIKYYRNYYRVYEFTDNIIFARAIAFLLLLFVAIVLLGFVVMDVYKHFHNM